MAAVQGGPNKLFAAGFTYDPAPNASYPEDPNDRLLIGQDGDWADLGLASPAGNLRSPGQVPTQNTLLWFGNDNSTAEITIDAGVAVGGDEFWIFGITGTGGIYSPKAIHVEHSDDGSSWTTAKNWTGLTPATSANVQGATIAVADISAAGDHQYWRATLTMGVNSSASGICGIEIRDAGTYNPLIFATTTYSTAPNSTWNDPPSSALLLDGDSDWQSGRRQRLTWEEYTQFESYATGGWINVPTSSPLTITFDAGSAIGGRRMMLGGLAWTAVIGHRPTSFSLDWSDDNSAWTTVASDSGMTSNPVTGQSPWLIDIDISAAGDHRYWRWVIDHGSDWYLLSNAHMVPTDGWYNVAQEAVITHSASDGTYPDYFMDTYRTGDTDWVDDDMSMVGWGYPGDQDTPNVGYTALSLAVDTGWPFTFDLGTDHVVHHVISWGWQGNNNIPQPEAFTIEWSDDNSAWTTAVSDSGLTSIDTGNNRWMMWAETGETDPHRYWRYTPVMGGTANEWIFQAMVNLWSPPAGGPIEVAVGTATEVETANPITPLISREVAVGQAVEVETANGITPRIGRNVPVGQATERELANGVTPVIGRMIPVGTATESETANGITPVIRREVLIGQATEVELARLISPVKPIFVPVQTAVERELARMITAQAGEPFLPNLTCEVIGLPVTCEVSGLEVQSAILSLEVDCEVT